MPKDCPPSHGIDVVRMLQRSANVHLSSLASNTVPSCRERLDAVLPVEQCDAQSGMARQLWLLACDTSDDMSRHSTGSATPFSPFFRQWFSNEFLSEEDLEQSAVELASAEALGNMEPTSGDAQGANVWTKGINAFRLAAMGGQTARAARLLHNLLGVYRRTFNHSNDPHLVAQGVSAEEDQVYSDTERLLTDLSRVSTRKDADQCRATSKDIVTEGRAWLVDRRTGSDLVKLLRAHVLRLLLVVGGDRKQLVAEVHQLDLPAPWFAAGVASLLAPAAQRATLFEHQSLFVASDEASRPPVGDDALTSPFILAALGASTIDELAVCCVKAAGDAMGANEPVARLAGLCVMAYHVSDLSAMAGASMDRVARHSSLLDVLVKGVISQVTACWRLCAVHCALLPLCQGSIMSELIALWVSSRTEETCGSPTASELVHVLQDLLSPSSPLQTMVRRQWLDVPDDREQLVALLVQWDQAVADAAATAHSDIIDLCLRSGLTALAAQWLLSPMPTASSEDDRHCECAVVVAGALKCMPPPEPIDATASATQTVVEIPMLVEAIGEHLLRFFPPVSCLLPRPTTVSTQRFGDASVHRAADDLAAGIRRSLGQATALVRLRTLMNAMPIDEGVSVACSSLREGLNDVIFTLSHLDGPSPNSAAEMTFWPQLPLAAHLTVGWMGWHIAKTALSAAEFVVDTPTITMLSQRVLQLQQAATFAGSRDVAEAAIRLQRALMRLLRDA